MAVTDPRPAHHDDELSVTGDLPGTSAGSNARPAANRRSAACVLAVRRMYVQGRGGGRAYLVVPLL
jgi:hypothetical protein